MDETLERAGVENVSQWAMRLNYDAGRVMAMPAAKLVPAEVLRVFSEMAALIGVMARKIEALEAGRHE